MNVAYRAVTRALEPARRRVHPARRTWAPDASCEELLQQVEGLVRERLRAGRRRPARVEMEVAPDGRLIPTTPLLPEEPTDEEVAPGMVQVLFRDHVGPVLQVAAVVALFDLERERWGEEFDAEAWDLLEEATVSAGRVGGSARRVVPALLDQIEGLRYVSGGSRWDALADQMGGASRPWSRALNESRLPRDVWSALRFVTWVCAAGATASPQTHVFWPTWSVARVGRWWRRFVCSLSVRDPQSAITTY